MRASILIPPPTRGVAFQNPRGLPREAALRLENLRVRDGMVRGRDGYEPLLDNPATRRITDIFSHELPDGTSEAIRADTTTHYRRNGSVWTAIVGGGAWTDNNRRYWSVVAPWAGTALGRILIGKDSDQTREWAGAATNMNAYAGAPSSRYGIMADDNRLIVGYTREAGTLRTQRVRWTVIGLPNGGANDWTGTGSGFLDLRNDSFPITGLFKLHGQVYVGKSRAICRLVRTGIQTDAYDFETLQTGGDGLFLPAFARHGNIVLLVSHQDVLLFDGSTFTSVGGPIKTALFRRLNYNALDFACATFDPAQNLALLALPLDGSTDPTEVWSFDPDTGAWETDIYGTRPTCLVSYANLDITEIQELVGQIDALAGDIESLSPSSSQRALIAFGTGAGETFIFTPDLHSDNGNLIQGTYVSSLVPVVGAEMSVAGKPHTIGPDDNIVLDKVRLALADIGATYSVAVSASGDGGKNFSSLGTLTVTTAGGTHAEPRFVDLHVTARLALRDTIQIRLVNLTTDAPWGWSDMVAEVDVVGKKLS